MVGISSDTETEKRRKRLVTRNPNQTRMAIILIFELEAVEAQNKGAKVEMGAQIFRYPTGAQRAFFKDKNSFLPYFFCILGASVHTVLYVIYR